ncbi:DUF4331 family protein [Streptomyces sp. NPDC059957]|uniref:DUF4331 family protein n=1 Tax=Streptomyces sp. NPDC059957 TaxID=3347016 RepID=UPI003659ABCA
MSDHLSSPRALEDPASDICDLYAFPSPGRQGHLTLVMTVFPRAAHTAFFADDVVCRFRLRPVSVAATGVKARFAVGADDTELILECTFSEPSAPTGGGRPVQVGTCTTPTHHEARAVVHDRSGGDGDGLRMFAGLVSDPFIFQLESIMETVTTGKLAFGKVTTNTMDGANVLGIVVEVDCARWLPDHSLVAVVGETLAAGKRPVRLERVGRPEIKNIGMQWPGYDPLNRTIDLRELYNQEDAFHLRDDYLDAYRSRLGANLSFYDGLDGKTDWPPDENGNHPLVDLLLQDFLVVDVTKPFAEDTWFGIEQDMLADRPHRDCGGRALNDDFLDTYYTLFISAGNGPRVSDGVDQATVPATDDFPYLAPPNPAPAPAVAEAGRT